MRADGRALDPVVGRARVARVYPVGRPDGVAAPQRVGPRVKPGDDEVAAPEDDVVAA
jgi:hypothetical protein